MVGRIALSSLLSVAVGSGVPGVPTVASAVPQVTAFLGAVADSPTAVFGLEGDEALGDLLTRALREELVQRGIGGGEPLTLDEVRLIMGCDGVAPQCLASAGDSMGAKRVIFGAVFKEEGVARVELHLLEVEGAVEVSQVNELVPLPDLTEEHVAAKAKELAETLLAPKAPEPEPAPVPVPEGVDDGVAPSDTEPDLDPEPAPEGTTDEGSAALKSTAQDSSRYEWGAYKPRPSWKRAGFGVGVTLTALGAGAFIGTAISLRYTLRDDLLEAAEASTQDYVGDELNTANDVDPNSDEDICLRAEAAPPGEPDRVTNASIAEICNRADIVQVANWVSAGVMAAGAVTTVVFTTLLFVRKKNGGGRASRSFERMAFSGGPMVGGWSIAGQLRF